VSAVGMKQAKSWALSPAVLSPRIYAWTKAVIFVLCLLPMARLVIGAPLDLLGVNPVETIRRSTGTWTLVFLLATLSVTPLRRITGWHWLARLRRMLGLYAFFYAVLHLISYVWLEQFFDVEAIIKDIVKRPFITIGFAAFVLMIPLAATSTNAMVKRMGGKNWTALHRLVYVLAVCGVIHFWWLVKRDITQPLIYALVLSFLLGYRVLTALRRRPG
jgi:methionine sulfoxide reductase heme-binding subunit